MYATLPKFVSCERRFERGDDDDESLNEGARRNILISASQRMGGHEREQ